MHASFRQPQQKLPCFTVCTNYYDRGPKLNRPYDHIRSSPTTRLERAELWKARPGPESELIIHNQLRILIAKKPCKVLLPSLSSRHSSFQAIPRRFRVSSADSPSTSPLAPSSASEEEGDRSNRRWIDSLAYISYIVGLGLPVGLASSPVLLIPWISIGRGECGGPGDGVGKAEALSFCVGPWRIKGNLATFGVLWGLWLLARLCYLCCCGRFAQ